MHTTISRFGEPLPGIPDTTLDTMLLRPGSQVASRTTLIDAETGERWTHQDLSERALAAAADFRRSGIDPGERVVLSAPNGIGFVAGLFGLLAAGAVVSPVIHGSPAPELARRAACIGARRVLSGSRSRTTLSRIAPGSGADSGTEAAAPTGLALLPWSSGTTGSPKPIAVTHRNLIAGQVQLSLARHLTPDDVLLGVLPFSHLFGMQYILNQALLTGATMVLLPRWDSTAALDAVDTYGITLVHAVPSMVHDLAKRVTQGRWRLGSLQQVLSGGSPLSAQTARCYEQALGVPVDGAYGLTEAGASHFARRGAPRRPGCCGQPVPGIDYRVVPGPPDVGVRTDECMGGTGELHLRGPQIADGYLKPDGSLVRFTDAEGWFATGDLVRVHDDGCLEVIDRLKDIIKYRGHQISPSEVEGVLREHPAVQDALLVAAPYPRDGEVPLARVVLTPGHRLTAGLEGELQEFITQRLAVHNRPRRITAVTSVERTASGKPLRGLCTPEAPDTHGPAANGSTLTARDEPDLTARTVLITGGSRGFGRAMASAFLRHGARVLITGRDPAALAETRKALGPLGVLGTAAVDSTDLAALHGFSSLLDRRGIMVDTLICNSGVPGPVGPAWENDPEQWWSTQESNVLGTYLPCRVFLPSLIERHGRVIIVASRAGLHRWPLLSAYSVSKAAVIKLAENLASELRRHDVPVFAYHPGLLTIGMAAAHFDEQFPPDSWKAHIQSWYLKEHAEGRTTATDRGTRGALLLAAGAADRLSGHYLTPDHPALLGPLPTRAAPVPSTGHG
ncbi:SDR family NAD(P)-dependent oxidoreductase [Kitasatospora sp. NPDC058046]|uniref:SDR family NAD(P)-dependent oxidoreductase n=1 Tax=Kitasatospora sp. NPDC058046 TaxID=3346312 RepID=UPI0036DD76A3